MSDYLTIAIVTISIFLIGYCIWIFLFKPKRQSKTQNTPSQLNSVPKSTNIHEQRSYSRKPETIKIPNKPNQESSSAFLSAKKETELRRNLLQKLLGDEKRLERLIEFERKKDPTAGQVVWLKAAVERWEKDNR